MKRRKLSGDKDNKRAVLGPFEGVGAVVKTKTWVRALAPVGVCLAVVLLSRVALAGNAEAESEALILRGCRWFQRVITLAAGVAVAEGFSRFWSEAKSQGAREHMKLVLIGVVGVFASVGIVEIIKNSFSTKL